MTRRAAIITGAVIGSLAGLLGIVALVVFFGANTAPGRQALAWLLPRLTQGEIHAYGISGRFPFELAARRLTVSDAKGPWLSARNFHLTWQPAALFHGKIIVDQIAARTVDVARLPVATKSSTASHTSSRPMPLRVRALAIGHVVIAPALAPGAPSFSLAGSLSRKGAQAATISLKGNVASGGHIVINGKQDDKTLTLDFSATEPAHGLIAALANLPDLGPIRIVGHLAGPRDALRMSLEVHGGALVLNGSGTIDLVHRKADVAVSLHAPAMAPRPDLRWQHLALGATLRGNLERPTVSGLFTASGLAIGRAKIAELEASAQGAEGHLQLTARISNLQFPGKAGALFSHAPFLLDARINLRAAGAPIVFTLRHPLIEVRGSLAPTKPFAARAVATLPDLAPFAALAHAPLTGSAMIRTRITTGPSGPAITAHAAFAKLHGHAAWFRLLGEEPTLALSAALQKGSVTITKFSLDGSRLAATAMGTLSAKKSTLTFTAGLSDLAGLEKNVTGALRVRGRLTGNPANLTLEAALDGTLGAMGEPASEIETHVTASGPPATPRGEFRARWMLEGAPLEIAMNVKPAEKGAIAVHIQRARWRNTSVEGELALRGFAPEGGEITFRSARLADFSKLAHTPLEGAIAGTLNVVAGANSNGTPTPTKLVLAIDAQHLADEATAIGAAKLRATISDPMGARELAANLALTGVELGGVSGSRLTLTAKGNTHELALALNAATPAVGGATLTSSARLDIPSRRVRVSLLKIDARSESIRLLAPVNVKFAPGITIENARFAVAGARFAVNGQLTPKLALALAVQHVTPALLAAFAPALRKNLPLTGELNAEATLHGTLANPLATLHAEAQGLRLTSPRLVGLPVGTLVLNARLANHILKTSGKFSAGSAIRAAVSGNVPLDPAGKLALTGNVNIDFAAFDPLLSAEGRRTAGELSTDIQISGRITAPTITGNASLTRGMVADYANGLAITNIGGRFTFSEGTLHILQLAGHAGPGSIGLSGSVGITTPGMPIALHLTARNAEPLNSDRLRAWLDSNLSIDGSLAHQLALKGEIRIRRAEIAIPKRMPANIAVLDVVRPGEHPARGGASGASPGIGLDLLVNAPRQVFVRGRGLDAEFGGRIHLTGSSKHPEIIGGLHLIRGDLALAGQTLTFTKGAIGFNGGDPTDPTLDVVATKATASSVASLTIGGTAQHPSVTLSSTPDLPQDQILAMLVFGQSGATLSPLQLVEIASGLASLSGTGPSVAGPLGSIRTGLGLDRLTIGSGANGSPTVQAGRYIAKGVYVGASQAANGAGSSANVEIDLSKHLKLHARVGSRASGPAAGTAADQSTSVGLSYQFEY